MIPPTKIAIVAVTRRGVDQARLLRRRLRLGEVHRPERYGPAEHPWELPFDGPLAERVPGLFAGCEQLVFFLAVGAVTRLVAPCLASKETDPGVLAVDEAGRFVIPLLSGHKGGANAFARTVAGYLGATPVITTASDVIGGLSLDLLEEEHGWTAEPRDRLKEAALALVNGAAVAIIQEIGQPGGWLDERDLPCNVTFVREVTALSGREFESVVWITDRVPREPLPIDPERVLWFRPRSLVLGVGCERGISAAALEYGLDRFLSEEGFARASIGTLASVDLKADEQAIGELAQRYGWQTVFYGADELARVAGTPNPSEVVARCVGTPGVAEPAALLASEARRLLVEKQVVSSPLAPQRMTFALARSAAFEAPTGEPARVVFVGAGPGDPDLLTLKAHRALGRADVVVYAGSLVPEEILRHAPATAVLHNSAPLTLEEVMAILVPAARAGKRVVRLHSGDTSLYSAIQEQMTRLDEAGVGYEVIPGVSSFQAAAAALKAEFTLPEVVQTVILTRAEGETPMPEGESLAALAQHRATLCVFLSARLVERVQDELLTAYAADTPVAILYRVSWPDEKVVLTELWHLAEEVRRNKLSRTTLIVVGAAVCRRQNRSRLYDKGHGHIFRGRDRDEASPPA
ncbi:MAG TPA: precorrin-4 C(11)-methyltransferase [Gemmataceae bacterium]|nr:precorrin-4 C(11)-methyltransferase [Gemmataceae bacterium]